MMMSNAVECSGFWKGSYQLIDSGNREKLEKFGPYVIRRPEPQALWTPDLPEREWMKMADASFFKEAKNPEKGNWEIKEGTYEQFWMNYKLGSNHDLKFRLGFTSFKHLGLFPEQAFNWEFLFEKLKLMKTPKVLNLFAYTGGASLACRAAGAEVVHLDAVKQVVSWAKENMISSKLDNIRWIVDDASKFAEREVRRANTYDAIILDPPAYGRGPEGEKWTLEEDIFPLLGHLKQLCHSNTIVVANLYSMGLSVELLNTMMKKAFGFTTYQSGELFMADEFGKNLPLGISFRNG